MDLIYTGVDTLISTAGDVLPIILFIVGFQVFVIRQPLHNVRRVLAGLACTVIGLGLFLIGLERCSFHSAG